MEYLTKSVNGQWSLRKTEDDEPKKPKKPEPKKDQFGIKVSKPFSPAADITEGTPAWKENTTAVATVTRGKGARNKGSATSVKNTIKEGASGARSRRLDTGIVRDIKDRDAASPQRAHKKALEDKINTQKKTLDGRLDDMMAEDARNKAQEVADRVAAHQTHQKKRAVADKRVIRRKGTTLPAKLETKVAAPKPAAKPKVEKPKNISTDKKEPLPADASKRERKKDKGVVRRRKKDD